MTAAAIEELFHSFNNCKVLVVGDVMLDSYLWGSSNRISPEAPVPIVSVKSREKRLGGAANVALNILAMGATPFLCTLVGDDSEGQEFFELLEKRGLSNEGVVISSERKTTVKHRIIAASQHLLRVDSEDEFPATIKESELLKERFNNLLDKVDVVLFQDYDKGVLSVENVEEFIKITKLKAKKSIVDPKKKQFFSYKGVDVFKPNLKELAEGINQNIDKHNQLEIEAGVRLLQKEISADQVLVTLSENGVYIGNGQRGKFSPAHIRKIADVSGAGDTVVSVAALCLANNTSPKFLSELSNLSGGLVCEQVGVVPVDKGKLLEEALIHLVE